MEQLLDLILGSGLNLAMLDPDLLALDAQLPKSDVMALFMLQRRGEATMTELAADLGAPLSTATGIGARLARRGLVERHRDERDRRVIIIRLTAEGQALAARIKGKLDQMLQRVQAVLSPEEMQQLVGLVLKVIRVLRTGGPAGAADTTETGPRRIPIEE